MNNFSARIVGSGVPGDFPVPAVAGGAETSRAIPLLTQYWRVAIRWKWVIAGTIVAALAAGLIITLLMTPLYTSTATIEISRQRENIVNVEGLEPNESASVDMEFYQTQYSLLEARSLAEKVADDLNLAKDNQFFETFGVDPDDRGLFADSRNARLTPAQLQARRDKAVDLLLDNISISPVRGSRLVQVSFTSPSPELSMRVVNAWTANFIKSNLERRFEATSYARNFLEDRLEQLRQKLEESERRLVAYAGNQKIINIAASDDSPNGQTREHSLQADELVNLNNALAEATAARVAAESRMRKAGGASAEALSNPAINQLRQKRAEVAADYAKMMAQFAPDYPPAKALAQQLSALDQSIAREEARVRQSLVGAYQDALRQENMLKAKVDQLKGSMLDLRRRTIQYNIYQRDVDTNRELYNGLLQRYKEIGIAGGVGTNNVSVVDPGILPEAPSSPRLVLNMLLALLAGMALSGLLVVGLEQVDETIRDPEDVKRGLDLPLLGTIPTTDEDPVDLLGDRKSGLAEAYMSLQTSLQFSTDHGVPRSIAVTSTRASEGKSTSAYAIAQSLARTKRSVVLVDGDMRSPSVAQMVGATNKYGLSNFLAGDDNVDGMIVHPENRDFAIVPAGPIPPNAAELLTGPRLRHFFEALATRFDHVVIDSPPVLGLADAPLISSNAEGIVYVVQSEGARSSMIRTALARLRAANVNLLGVVLTKFNAQRAHYGYGYDYGYGYGRADGEAA